MKRNRFISGLMASLLITTSAKCVVLKKMADGGSCIPKEQCTLQSVRPWDSEQKVTKIFGSPQKITFDSGEDDGGQYKVRKLFFENLEVEIVRGKVDRIFTHSPKVSLPSGIRQGLQLSDVQKLLGSFELNDKLEVNITRCPDPDGSWSTDVLTFQFDKNHFLQEIEINANRP